MEDNVLVFATQEDLAIALVDTFDTLYNDTMAPEVETKKPEPGELLIIQERQEELYHKDKILESLSVLIVISEDTAKAQIHYYGSINSQAAVSLQNDLFVLKNKTKIRDIDLYIYCLGGDMFAGFAMIETIKMAGFTDKDVTNAKGIETGKFGVIFVNK